MIHEVMEIKTFANRTWKKTKIVIRIKLKQPMIPYSKQAITEEDEIAVNNAIVSP